MLLNTSQPLIKVYIYAVTRPIWIIAPTHWADIRQQNRVLYNFRLYFLTKSIYFGHLSALSDGFYDIFCDSAPDICIAVPKLDQCCF